MPKHACCCWSAERAYNGQLLQLLRTLLSKSNSTFRTCLDVQSAYGIFMVHTVHRFLYKILIGKTQKNAKISSCKTITGSSDCSPVINFSKILQYAKQNKQILVNNDKLMQDLPWSYANSLQQQLQHSLLKTQSTDNDTQ